MTDRRLGFFGLLQVVTSSIRTENNETSVLIEAPHRLLAGQEAVSTCLTQILQMETLPFEIHFQLFKLQQRFFAKPHGVGLLSLDKKDQSLARVVDLDLFVDVVEDGLHLVLQAVQLVSFPLQLPLIFLIALLQLWMGQTFRNIFTH